MILLPSPATGLLRRVRGGPAMMLGSRPWSSARISLPAWAGWARRYFLSLCRSSSSHEIESFHHASMPEEWRSFLCRNPAPTYRHARVFADLDVRCGLGCDRPSAGEDIDDHVPPARRRKARRKMPERPIAAGAQKNVITRFLCKLTQYSWHHQYTIKAHCPAEEMQASYAAPFPLSINGALQQSSPLFARALDFWQTAHSYSV